MQITHHPYRNTNINKPINLHLCTTLPNIRSFLFSFTVTFLFWGFCVILMQCCLRALKSRPFGLLLCIQRFFLFQWYLQFNIKNRHSRGTVNNPYFMKWHFAPLLLLVIQTFWREILNEHSDFWYVVFVPFSIRHTVGFRSFASHCFAVLFAFYSNVQTQRRVLRIYISVYAFQT